MVAGVGAKTPVEATMDLLRQLETEPLHSSYQRVLDWRNRVSTPASVDDFKRGSAPFAAFLSTLAMCVQTAVCDRQTAVGDWICPAALAYFAEATRKDVPSDAEQALEEQTLVQALEQAPGWQQAMDWYWEHTTSMAMICSLDKRYSAEFWKSTVKYKGAIPEWDTAGRHEGPDKR
jgi:hypothetical protein